MPHDRTYNINQPYTVIAHHAGHKSSNHMHADGLPQKLGFRGAFVLGLATYGNMTRGLVSHFGADWLGRAVIDAKFLKPVCEGDRLRIETRAIAGREPEQAYEVTAHNEMTGGEICARLETSVPVPFPQPDTHAGLQPVEWEGPVTQRRTWENVVIGQPYRSLRHTLSAADNAHWIRVLEDDVPLYTQGANPPLHPAHVLRQVQMGYNNQFIGDNAIHSSTRAVIHQMLRVGDTVHVLTVPVEKWEKKQNHWLTVYCAVRRDGELCAEIYHTQIFRVRGFENPAAATSAS